jgi:hypothetical protein
VRGVLAEELTLFFASRGAGRLLWPVLAGSSRLVLASVGGWMAIRWLDGGLPALFGVMALAFVVYGLAVALAVKSGAWRAVAPRDRSGS